MDFLAGAALDARAIYNGEFSEPVTVSDGSVTSSVRGIVDMTHQEVDSSTGVIVMSVHPRVSLWLPDIPFEVRQGHIVSMRGENYTVRDVEQQGDISETGGDGSGILILNRE